MSDKTTEEAAEEKAMKEILQKASRKYNSEGFNELLYWQDDAKIKLSVYDAMHDYSASLSTTIAQLREENERYRKCLEFLRQEAYSSEPYLYSPDVLAFIEKALTPKPPKIKGE